MPALCDVSFLLPLCYGRHVHHAAARQWVDGSFAAASLVICRVSQLGFLRLLTNPAVMTSDVCSTRQAWRLHDRLMSDVRFVFHDEPAGLERHLRQMTHGFSFSPKLWQDAYLAAFARAAGLALATFDRGFQQFPRLKVVLLPA